jgi:hypothetical protein
MTDLDDSNAAIAFEMVPDARRVHEIIRSAQREAAQAAAEPRDAPGETRTPEGTYR